MKASLQNIKSLFPEQTYKKYLLEMQTLEHDKIGEKNVKRYKKISSFTTYTAGVSVDGAIL